MSEFFRSKDRINFIHTSENRRIVSNQVIIATNFVTGFTCSFSRWMVKQISQQLLAIYSIDASKFIEDKNNKKPLGEHCKI